MWCHVVVLALPVGAHAQEMTAAKAGSLAGFRVSKCRLKRQPRPMSHWNSFARTSNSFNLPNIRPIRRIFSFFLFHFFHVFFLFFFPNIFHVFHVYHVLCSHMASSAVPSNPHSLRLIFRVYVSFSLRQLISI